MFLLKAIYAFIGSYLVHVNGERITGKNTKTTTPVYYKDIPSFYDSLEGTWLHQTQGAITPEKLAIHRAIGKNHSATLLFSLLLEEIEKCVKHENIKFMDAGCGMGGGSLFMSQNRPKWDIKGYTLAPKQFEFITQNITTNHHFQVFLKSYDEITDNFDAIMSIEAVVHSPNVANTFKIWSSHLNSGGVIALIDDYLVNTKDRNHEAVKQFEEGWMLSGLQTPAEMDEHARNAGLVPLVNRDLDKEFQINLYQYQNTAKSYKARRFHNWINGQHMARYGSVARKWLMVNHMISYSLLVYQKP